MQDSLPPCILWPAANLLGCQIKYSSFRWAYNKPGPRNFFFVCSGLSRTAFQGVCGPRDWRIIGKSFYYVVFRSLFVVLHPYLFDPCIHHDRHIHAHGRMWAYIFWFLFGFLTRLCLQQPLLVSTTNHFAFPTKDNSEHFTLYDYCF